MTGEDGVICAEGVNESFAYRVKTYMKNNAPSAKMTNKAGFLKNPFIVRLLSDNLSHYVFDGNKTVIPRVN